MGMNNTRNGKWEIEKKISYLKDNWLFTIKLIALYYVVYHA